MSEVAAPAAPAAPSTSAPSPSTPSSTPASNTSSLPSNVNASPPSAADRAVPTGKDTPATNDHPEAQPGETKAETVQRLKLKVKVNGKELEREFDPTELQLYVQKGMGADEKFQKAAEVQKTFAQLQKALKDNPFEALKDPAFGIDLEQLAIQHLAKKFEMEEKQKADPLKFELEQYKEKVAKYEAEQAKAAEERKAAAAREQNERMWAETEKSWLSALEKSGLGPNKAYIRQMAEIGRDFLDAGLDLQPELIIAEMKNRMAESQKLLMGNLSVKELVGYLGEDRVNEIMALKVAELKAARAAPEPLKAPEAPKPPKSPEEVDSSAALRAMFDFKRGF